MELYSQNLRLFIYLLFPFTPGDTNIHLPGPGEDGNTKIPVEPDELP
jgi:hypothetical protein